MSVYEKLLNVQKELKAPKNQYNSFGKYNYRSCEDILEGLKPVLEKYNATLFITDTLDLIGERYYVKATVKFIDCDDGSFVENSAYARESIDKRGMDDSQITGATSSYARKYALNGMFLIDDTKDSDTDEYQNVQKNAKPTQKKETKTEPKAELQTDKVDKTLSQEVPQDRLPTGQGMTPVRLAKLKKAMEFTGKNDRTVLATAKVKSYDEMTETSYLAIMALFDNLMTEEQKKIIEEING